MHLRLALLYESTAAYGTPAFLAEPVRPRVEGAIRRLALACVVWSVASTSCFTRQERGGILVSRILHQRMLPELHSIGDQHDQP